MNVHFQCVIQVCRNSCPEPTCDGAQGGPRPSDLSYAASSNSQAVTNAGVDPRVPVPINSGARAPQKGYTSVKREGIAAETEDKEEERLYLGRPRMVNLDTNATSTSAAGRTKRDVLEMTDVSTTRLIQVVAPGDVAFTLNPNQNETVVVQNLRDLDANNICLSVPSFVGGLTMLLLVLIIACMVAVFLLLRVRQFDSNKKVSTTNSMASLAHLPYDHSDFVKVTK